MVWNKNVLNDDHYCHQMSSWQKIIIPNHDDSAQIEDCKSKLKDSYYSIKRYKLAYRVDYRASNSVHRKNGSQIDTLMYAHYVLNCLSCLWVVRQNLCFEKYFCLQIISSQIFFASLHHISMSFIYDNLIHNLIFSSFNDI